MQCVIIIIIIIVIKLAVISVTLKNAAEALYTVQFTESHQIRKMLLEKCFQLLTDGRSLHPC